MRPLIVTADDYAMSAAIDEGIVELINAGRVSATSCMTLSPRWPEAARLLTADVRARCHLGLHLDLTEFAASPLPLGRLIVRAYARRLDPATLRRTIADQLARFEAALGQAPNYVDGHQHVHQLPQVREALIEVLARRYPAGAARPWLRISDAGVAQGWKGRLIAALGSRALRTLARGQGLVTTGRLLGVYGFEGDAARFMQRLRHWLPHTQGATALMCHPAARLDAADPLGPARYGEYQALRGEGFAALLLREGITVVRSPS
ncbi:MAG: ChbG/HpnK family deacetylase [Burkholderiales bacterium]|nr:ChbG/HpnK family deacetylase [Burkholderiales bacterium]